MLDRKDPIMLKSAMEKFAYFYFYFYFFAFSKKSKNCLCCEEMIA